MSTNDEVVEWRTFSGKKHKFGPATPVSGWRNGATYRSALCNRSIIAESWHQDEAATTVCKRCFPDGA